MRTVFRCRFSSTATSSSSPSYCLTFVLLGWTLFTKGKGLSKVNVAATTLVVLGLGAGWMDVRENVHGLAALTKLPLPVLDLTQMRSASVIKWSLLGLICVPTAYAFWPARGWTLFRIISKVASVLLILAASVFAVGEFSPKLEHFWEFSVGCMALSGAFQILILVLWRREFDLSIDKKRYPEQGFAAVAGAPSTGINALHTNRGLARWDGAGSSSSAFSPDLTSQPSYVALLV